MKKFLTKRLRAELAVCLVAALVLTTALVAMIGVNAGGSPVSTCLFDAAHWTAAAPAASATDEAVITNGSSAEEDANESSWFNAYKIALKEDVTEGNYLQLFFDAAGTNDGMLSYRYNSDTVGTPAAKSKGATKVMLRVKLASDTLKNAMISSERVSSNYILDTGYSSTLSTDPDEALAIHLGDGCGVTFAAWQKALKDAATGKWVDLMLPISGTVPETVKELQLIHGPGMRHNINLQIASMWLFNEAGYDIYVNGDPEETATVLKLEGGPKYALTGNKELPQLTIPCEPVTVNETLNTIRLDMRVFGGTKLFVDNMIPGSCSALDGKQWTYDLAQDLAIYFEGVNVGSIGVTQGDFRSAFLDNNVIIGNELVTLEMPVRGGFREGATVNGINLMMSNGDKAPNLEGYEVQIENVRLLHTDIKAAGEGDILLELDGGPDYVFNGNSWDPQLIVASADTPVNSKIVEMDFDLKFADVETLLNGFNFGSRSSVGGGSFTYGPDDLGIYFNGSGTIGVGVLQSEFCDALSKNKDALVAGETVSMALPIAGEFADDAVIKGMNVMMTHDTAKLKDLPISFSNIVFKPEPESPTKPSEVVLSGGPEFKFTGNNWDPQLVINCDKIPVNSTREFLQMDVKLPDVETLLDNFTAGSRSSVGGGSYTYSYGADLGIYFGGTNVIGVGVLQQELKKALEDNRDKLRSGETVTMKLPISGNFPDDAVINKFNIQVSHDSPANALNGMPITLTNVKFLAGETAAGEEGELVLKKGPDLTFTGSAWYPQLTVETKNFDLIPSYKFMRMDLTLKDIDTLLDNFTMGSRSHLGGGDFQYNGEDLGIYFEGTNVGGIGITQGALKSILEQNRHDLADGKTVTIELPFSGDIPDGAKISKMNIMVSHDSAAGALSNMPVRIENIFFYENSIVPPEEEPGEEDTGIPVTSDDIYGANSNYVVNFSGKKLYVLNGTTAGDAIANFKLTDGFKSSMIYDGSALANKQKPINDQKFVLRVTSPTGDSVDFAIYPCEKGANGVIDTSKLVGSMVPKAEEPAEEQPKEEPEEIVVITEEGEPEITQVTYYETEPGETIVNEAPGTTKKVVKQSVTEEVPLYATWLLIVLAAASMLFGAGAMFLIDLLRNKKKG